MPSFPPVDDQLNIISGQLAKQGDINGEAVRIAAEQRTLLAAQLAQNGSDADARVRKEREEQRQKDYLLVNRTYNRGVIAGLTGAVKAGGKLPELLVGEGERVKGKG